MTDKFDFELVADDRVSASIQAINEAVKALQARLEALHTGLHLGGHKTRAGLSAISDGFGHMARHAKSGVQYIGDLVPPLKMVEGLGARLGVVGVGVAAAAAVAHRVWDGVKVFGEQGYAIATQAKNLSLTTRAYQTLTGALREHGMTQDAAEAGIAGLYDRANEALQGNDQGFIGLLTQVGIHLRKTRQGVADVQALIADIAAVMRRLDPAKQAFFAQKLGISGGLLNVLRLSADEVTRLKDQAQRDGLVISDDDLKNAQAFKQQMNHINAVWQGLSLSTESFVGSLKVVQYSVGGVVSSIDHLSAGILRMERFLKQPNWLTQAVEDIKALSRRAARSLGRPVGVQDLMKNKTGRHPAPQASSPDLLRRALSNAAFQKTLSLNDRLALAVLSVPPALERKLRDWDRQHPQARGLRNANPGNLRAAPHVRGRDGGLVQFASEEEGLAALSRQLQLYGDRGNNTLNGLIPTYAPATENNTQAYLDDVVKKTGFQPGQRLDLHDPAVLAALMAAIIRHENGTQPFSREEITAAIAASILDPRWRGLRDPSVLAQQQRALRAGQPSAGDSHPLSPVASTALSSESAQAMAQAVAQAVAAALKDKKFQVEVTLINPQTGEKKTVTGGGARVTTAMSY